MALPTRGRVVIETTAGELDIELWSKEAPRACRNFIALGLEGYYDGVIFHRIVPGFLIQTGDKTGSGGGGESFYGEPFEDEIHPRLRFPHRGIVAMANQGTKNTNDSQFFITLDRAEELHGKHTVFGRCVGDTIYNAARIGDSEIGPDNRPVYPPKIRSIRIVDNPFDDIIPRITAAERRAQQRAREKSMKEREEEISRRGAKKNTKLLSFGGATDGAADEEEEEVVFKKKPIFRPDLVTDTKLTNPNIGEIPDFVTQIPKGSDKVTPSTDEKIKKQKEKEEDITKIRKQHAQEKSESQSSRAKEITSLESQIRKLGKRTGGGSDSDDSEVERQKRKKVKTNYVEDEIAKYKQKTKSAKRKGKRRDESDVLAALSSFRGKLQGVEASPPPSPTEEQSAPTSDILQPPQSISDPTAPIEEEEPMEMDDSLDFFGHKLSFAKDNEMAAEAESMKAQRDYEVIDPRVRGARAKEEERERKRKDKERRGDGGGGGGGRGRGRR